MMHNPEYISSGDSPARVRRRWARRSLELVLIGAALYLAVELFSEVGWRQLVDELRTASRPLVAATTALLAMRYFAWNSRWQLSLHRVGVTRCFWRGTVAILAAAAVNHLTPSFRVFGGLLRARYISRARSHSFSATYGSVLFDQIANQTVMGVLSAVAFVLMALHLGRAGQAVAGILVVVSILLLVPLLLRRRRRHRAVAGAESEDPVVGFARRLRPLLNRGRDVLKTVESLLRDRRLIVSALATTLVYAALNMIAAWVSFVALGHPAPLGSVFLATSLGVTIGALSGTPGGGLTTEAAMVTCYGLLGIDQQAALAATLLYRGLHYLLILVFGVPALGTLELLHRRSLVVGKADESRVS